MLLDQAKNLDVQSISALAQIAVAFVTALATVALWFVTRVLAKKTRRLAKASSEPLVAVTLEPSEWSIIHVDQVVENYGNAAAFDVKVEIDPPLTSEVISTKDDVLWSSVDFLRPIQRLKTYIGEASEIWRDDHTIKVSWLRKPNNKKREEISYSYSYAKFKSKGRLGAQSPEHQIAAEIENLRNDWKLVAQGSRKVKVDNFSSDDRKIDAEAYRHHRLLDRDARKREKDNP